MFQVNVIQAADSGICTDLENTGDSGGEAIVKPQVLQNADVLAGFAKDITEGDCDTQKTGTPGSEFITVQSSMDVGTMPQ